MHARSPGRRERELLGREERAVKARTLMNWDKRDELAAMFMQAILTGRYAEGRDPAVEGKANARRAYDMASEFLEVRDEVGATGP
jgi:hypothetical protein